MLPKLRRCSKCGGEFPEALEYFKYTRTTCRKGWDSWCRQCCAAKCREYNKKNEEALKAKRQARHAANPFRKRLIDMRCRAKKQGVTVSVAEAEEVIRRFSGHCAICGSPVAGHMMCLDHCHATGRVRGVLCRNCNSALGCVEEDRRILAGLLTYLEGGVP